MKTIVDMAEGAVTGMVLKDAPEDIPPLDTCPFCALTKAKHFHFKMERARAAEPLELTHGDIVGLMPGQFISRCRYSFVLMVDCSRASWVLFLKSKVRRSHQI